MTAIPPPLQLYLGMVAFAVFMIAMYLCLPLIDRLIAYLERSRWGD